MLLDSERQAAEHLAALIRQGAKSADLQVNALTSRLGRRDVDTDYGRCIQAGVEPPLETVQRLIPALYRSIPAAMRKKLKCAADVDQFEDAIARAIVNAPSSKLPVSPSKPGSESVHSERHSDYTLIAGGYDSDLKPLWWRITWQSGILRSFSIANRTRRRPNCRL